ncbi:MAG: hypothetical protein ACREBJ_02095 [Nitrosotalea sp.]
MIRLFYNYYEDKNPLRKQEIDYCLQKNLANTLLTTVVVYTPGKPTYEFFFEQINKVTGPDDINIICNSDIFFDDTIKFAEKIQPKEMFAILRWEWLPGGARFYERPDSQDTWIVRGKIENVFGKFSLGIRGCDNRIAAEFQKAGYAVSNPAKTIRTYHVHTSMVRNYTMADVVDPPYFTIGPTSLP